MGCCRGGRLAGAGCWHGAVRWRTGSGRWRKCSLGRWQSRNGGAARLGASAPSANRMARIRTSPLACRPRPGQVCARGGGGCGAPLSAAGRAGRGSAGGDLGDQRRAAGPAGPGVADDRPHPGWGAAGNGTHQVTAPVAYPIATLRGVDKQTPSSPGCWYPPWSRPAWLCRRHHRGEHEFSASVPIAVFLLPPRLVSVSVQRYDPLAPALSQRATNR